MYVKFATTNDTAVSGLNYTSTNGLLRWVDGDSSSKTFTIPILDDDGVNQIGLSTSACSILSSRMRRTPTPSASNLPRG